jgi:hypothetical protein
MPSWEVFTFLMEYGYKLVFVRREGVVVCMPSQSIHFPSRYISGYNVVAFNANHHGARVRNVDLLCLASVPGY